MAKVLLIDDECDARDALGSYLAQFGHSVSCVESGQAALRSILASAPDVLVLDLLMPEMDGPGLLEILRSYLRLHAIPVVVWTGAGPGPVVEKARKMGVNAIFFKPSATFEQLRAAIESTASGQPGAGEDQI